MYSQLRSIFFIFCSVSLIAWGSSKPAEGEAKPEAKTEAKDEYGEVQGRVSTLQAKIKTSEDTIRKLLEEKQQTKDSAKTAEIIKNLVSEHKSMQKDIAEYEKARSYLQYRFPEKGLKGKRTYERFELRSLEEMEHEMTMETRLKKTLRKVRKQYGTPEKTEEAPLLKKSKKPHGSEEPAIAEPVIISK